jgi:hypothetical protein
MVWCFRCLRNLLGAIVALAGLLALTEVGLRIHRLTHSAAISSSEDECPLAIPSVATGWELQPAARKAWTSVDGAAVNFCTNSLGLRGGEVAVPKPAGLYRVMVLGDEAVLAPSLPEDATLPQRMQQRLQSTTQTRIEVLNAGLPHGAPETAAILHRQRLAALLPDLVLLHIHAGDVADDQTFRKWLVRDPQGQTLICAHPERRSPPKELPVAELRREFALIDRLWIELGDRWTETPAASRSRPQRLTAAAVEQMLSPVESLAAACRSTGTPLVICLAPTSDTELVAKLDDGGQFAAAAFAWIAQRNIPVVDGAATLRSRECFLTTSEGWSAAGHSQLADFLAMQILQNLRGPWSTPSTQPSMLPVNHTQPTAASDPRSTRLPR